MRWLLASAVRAAIRDIGPLLGMLRSYNTKIIHKPRIESKKGYLAEIKNEGKISGSLRRDVLFAVSPKDIKDGLLFSLKAYIDAVRVRSVKTIFEKMPDVYLCDLADAGRGHLSFFGRGVEFIVSPEQFRKMKPTLIIDPNYWDVTESTWEGRRISKLNVGGLGRILGKYDPRIIRKPEEESPEAYNAALNEKADVDRLSDMRKSVSISHEKLDESVIYYLMGLENMQIIRTKVLDREKTPSGIQLSSGIRYLEDFIYGIRFLDVQKIDLDGYKIRIIREKEVDIADRVKSLHRMQAALFIDLINTGRIF